MPETEYEYTTAPDLDGDWISVEPTGSAHGATVGAISEGWPTVLAYVSAEEAPGLASAILRLSGNTTHTVTEV